MKGEFFESDFQTLVWTFFNKHSQIPASRHPINALECNDPFLSFQRI